MAKVYPKPNVFSDREPWESISDRFEVITDAKNIFPEVECLGCTIYKHKNLDTGIMVMGGKLAIDRQAYILRYVNRIQCSEVPESGVLVIRPKQLRPIFLQKGR